MKRFFLILSCTTVFFLGVSCSKIKESYQNIKTNIGLAKEDLSILEEYKKIQNQLKSNRYAEQMNKEQNEYKTKENTKFKKQVNSKKKKIEIEKYKELEANYLRELALLKFENERLINANRKVKNSIKEYPVRMPASIDVPFNAVLLENENINFLYKKAEIDLKKGDYKNAKILFKELLEKNPEHELASISNYWLGEIAEIQNDKISALSYYMQSAISTKDVEKRAVSYFSVAKIYDSINKKNLANKYYNMVIKLSPDSKFGVMALDKLK